MKALYHKILPAACVVLYLLCAGLAVWNAIGALRYRIGFMDYPQPYRATVVGFEAHFGGRFSSYAPIVKVSPRGHPEFTFTSQIFGLFNWVSVGDQVEIVRKTAISRYDFQVEYLEINSAFHLWVRDVLRCALILLLPVLVFGVDWAKDRYDRKHFYD